MSPTVSPTGIRTCGARCGARPSWPNGWPANGRWPNCSGSWPPCGWTPSLLEGVSSLQWQGPNPGFEDVCRHFRDPALAERVAALANR